MKRTMLKSKIHRATVTDANLNYVGSIGVDPELLEAADIMEFEKVDIYNITNGERFSTYAIKGNKGEITLNGAAARLVQRDDLIIIACYSEYDENELENFEPKLIFVNEKNEQKELTE